MYRAKAVWKSKIEGEDRLSQDGNQESSTDDQRPQKSARETWLRI